MNSGCLIALGPDDNQLVTVNRDQGLVWDLANNKVVVTFAGFGNSYGLSLMQAAIDPTGRYLALNCNETCLRLWDLTTGGAHLASESQHRQAILAAAFAPDGRFVATGSGDGFVRIWNGGSGELLSTLDAGHNGQLRLAFTNDGKRLAVIADDYDYDELKFAGALRVFSVPEGELVLERRLPDRAAALTLSRDSRRVAVGSGMGKYGVLEPGGERSATISIWELATGAKLAELSGYQDRIQSLDWSDDDRVLFAALEDHTVRQIEAASAAEIHKVELPHQRLRDGRVTQASINEAVFFENGTRALTHGSRVPEIHCWELPSGKKLWSITTPGTSVWKLALSPDRRMIAGAWRGEHASGLQLWDTTSQQLLLSRDLAGEDVYALAFSPDGRQVVTGFWSGSALVWDVAAALEQSPGNLTTPLDTGVIPRKSNRCDCNTPG